jgi:DNA invertase Pin-like site-specific DNA recombinase
MLIGYARVSTQDQTLNLQKDALEKLGCNKIFTDTASGAKAERTGLNEALEYVREGDTLVLWRLDRLGRSLKHLIETITELIEFRISNGYESFSRKLIFEALSSICGISIIYEKVNNNRKIGFKSIQENIDTTTSGGKLVFHIFGALAEFERDIIRERTQAGLQAARARGRKGGRPKSLTDKKTAMAQALYNDKNNTVDEICKTLNISRATLYRYIIELRINNGYTTCSKCFKYMLSRETFISITYAKLNKP